MEGPRGESQDSVSENENGSSATDIYATTRSATEREEQGLGQIESLAVNRSKVLVYLALFITAVVTGVTTYLLLSRTEKESFESEVSAVRCVCVALTSLCVEGPEIPHTSKSRGLTNSLPLFLSAATCHFEPWHSPSITPSVHIHRSSTRGPGRFSPVPSSRPRRSYVPLESFQRLSPPKRAAASHGGQTTLYPTSLSLPNVQLIFPKPRWWLGDPSFRIRWPLNGSRTQRRIRDGSRKICVGREWTVLISVHSPPRLSQLSLMLSPPIITPSIFLFGKVRTWRRSGVFAYHKRASSMHSIEI